MIDRRNQAGAELIWSKAGGDLILIFHKNAESFLGRGLRTEKIIK